MKNAIAGYVSANTAINIEYESGNVGGDGPTRSDVIKKLNTSSSRYYITECCC
ncbi:hypothetical protein [Clostridium oceanicum]|uniref:Uncharacterized protein n=1 Tax=Clostridium oceanicum TaxID=1543 RepID=A0ABN1JFX0_9CLOT